jgi:hypothetical protein
MPRRLSKRKLEDQARENAAYDLMGVAFVKLLRDREASAEHSKTAWDIAEFLYTKFTRDEWNTWIAGTGILLETLPESPEPYDHPRPDDGIPF